MELHRMSCDNPEATSPPISADNAKDLLLFIPLWTRKPQEGKQKLVREFRFEGFNDAFEFTSKIARLADEEDHHPLIILEWGKVSISWWTHKINALHLNDFIMAAKTDIIAEANLK